jgi:membrane-associated phospholipid phosphatase
MPWPTRFALVGSIMALTAARAEACERMAFWSRLPQTAEELATPLPLLMIGSSVIAPATMAPTGADHQLRLYAMQELHGKPNAERVSIWTPFVLPAVLLGANGVAAVTEQCSVVRPTSAMLQAMGITLIIATSLKFVAGRTWPAAGRDPNAPGYLDHPESARQFNWFSWHHGYAWPSGHTAIMFSAATALFTVEYRRSWLGYVAYSAAAAVAAGMWLGDHHWMSDIVSGALIGSALGRSVGIAFRHEGPPRSEPRLTIVPYTGHNAYGLQAHVNW